MDPRFFIDNATLIVVTGIAVSVVAVYIGTKLDAIIKSHTKGK